MRLFAERQLAAALARDVTTELEFAHLVTLKALVLGQVYHPKFFLLIEHYAAIYASIASPVCAFTRIRYQVLISLIIMMACYGTLAPDSHSRKHMNRCNGLLVLF